MSATPEDVKTLIAHEEYRFYSYYKTSMNTVDLLSVALIATIKNKAKS